MKEWSINNVFLKTEIGTTKVYLGRTMTVVPTPAKLPLPSKEADVLRKQFLIS